MEYPARYQPDLYPRQTAAGLWLLHELSPEYLAWKGWLAAEIGRRVFPRPVMVVWFHWPPTTQEGADFVFDKINEARAAEDSFATSRKHQRVINPAPLLKRLKPWEGYAAVTLPRDRRFTPHGQDGNLEFGRNY